MAPYDSDSDDDDVDAQYTETNVLLGYADPQDQDQADDDDDDDNTSGANETVSRLGGRPDWLGASEKGDTVAPPSAALGRCLVCKAVLVLLLQLNGELPDRFPGHERRLYVLACRNKACRRKPGTIRVIRGVRVDAAAVETEAKAAAERQKQKEAAAKAAAKPATVAPRLGDSVFGANPFAAGGGGGGGNPFSIGVGAATGAPKNPFSIGAAAAAPAPAETKPETNPEPKPESKSDSAQDLPKTFAETLSLNSDQEPLPTATAAAPPEPWPPVDTWPAAYPVSWIADAEYETLDPTPAAMPVQNVSTEAMEVDDGGSGGAGSSGKEDKFVYESSMDAAFQKFADRIAQNPDQVIRYEFAGQPLLCSKDDTVAAVFGQQGAAAASNSKVTTKSALPPCPNCRAKRVFEVQLMPHAIDLLEASELGLEGMDWGTIVVGVCEKDCQARGTASGAASYLEEWVGVQWEELQAQR